MPPPVDQEAWRKKAEQGDPDAQYEWGKHKKKRKNKAKDNAEATRWFHAARAQFRKAADQGDAHAQLQLGRMLEYGHGVEADPAEAAKWYRLAANQDDAQAQYTLKIYRNEYLQTVLATGRRALAILGRIRH